ncbi:magnesium transporter [Xylanimonas oleitrophica]|uniref:Magnesium transporter MgtE n=1 Tax=Xylanimonas oleitrophica TaxID=2607479 RepID=A0A2W5WMM2_9MICO|nr:magnesium transporter [Xylanimonas oleitrophica]PZR52779.1 magnesium transporter [Xylanimonas oleitrophica]
MTAREDQTLSAVEDALSGGSLTDLRAVLGPLSPADVLSVLERLGRKDQAVLYRLLSKDVALQVFEGLDAPLQSDLLSGLRDDEVTSLFAGLDPDDRVSLLDELPAKVAGRLLRGLSAPERAKTAEVLGYPHGSIGRRMSPEHVAVRVETSVADALARVHAHLDDAETVYTLPVVDAGRRLVGVVSLRDLLRAGPHEAVGSVMTAAHWVEATTPAETAARECADRKLLALPVTDADRRLVGLLTVDDALAVLEAAESEDAARAGGTEPLRRPYLSTPAATIVRSRVVWLLALAVGASLTVQVLDAFETTLEQMVVLSLFVPLVIGTGGNTGNQAATTITRALALDDVRPRDVLRVLGREARVGLALGAMLGAVGLCVVALLYGTQVGLVIGLTLLIVCTLAASVGGVMPLVARSLRVDPAVFSNPFITTFVDATGLVVYFLVARAVLGL